MRTVTLQLNVRANPEINWSVKTEVLVDNDQDAETAGAAASEFLMRFQQGMGEGFNQHFGNPDEDNNDE